MTDKTVIRCKKFRMYELKDNPQYPALVDSWNDDVAKRIDDFCQYHDVTQIIQSPNKREILVFFKGQPNVDYL